MLRERHVPTPGLSTQYFGEIAGCGYYFATADIASATLGINALIYKRTRSWHARSKRYRQFRSHMVALRIGSTCIRQPSPPFEVDPLNPSKNPSTSQASARFLHIIRKNASNWCARREELSTAAGPRDNIDARSGLDRQLNGRNYPAAFRPLAPRRRSLGKASQPSRRQLAPPMTRAQRARVLGTGTDTTEPAITRRLLVDAADPQLGSPHWRSKEIGRGNAVSSKTAPPRSVRGTWKASVKASEPIIAAGFSIIRTTRSVCAAPATRLV